MAALRVAQAPPWATVVVGEAPSRTSDPISPLLGGRSGSFLCRLAGLQPYQAAFLFRFVNLLPEWPALHAKRRLVRAAGLRLRPALLGRRAAGPSSWAGWSPALWGWGATSGSGATRVP